MEKTETLLQQATRKAVFDAIAFGMIHDINNILSSILGFAELAKMGFKIGANVEKDLDEVLTASLHARESAGRLSAYIRQAGIRATPVDVVLLIKETLKLLKALLPAAIGFSFHSGEAKGKILADPVQFHHILIILCVNVSHAMGKKAGRLEIYLKDTRHGDKNIPEGIDLKPGQYFQMSIADTGNGMHAEKLERMYAPFRTPDWEGLFPGLFLAQGLVREMGGAISVCDKFEKGTIFHMLFPKYANESDEAVYGAITDH